MPNLYTTVHDCQDFILNYKHKGVHIPIGEHEEELASWVLMVSKLLWALDPSLILDLIVDSSGGTTWVLIS